MYLPYEKTGEKKKKPNVLWVPTQVRWRNCFPFSKEKLTNLPPFRGIFQMPITTGCQSHFFYPVGNLTYENGRVQTLKRH